jgi:hypothetical protein
MSEQRTEVADVVVDFRAEYTGRNHAAIAMVQRQGLAIDSLDDPDGVVTGTIPADRLDALQNLPCVADVRVVEYYITQTPPALSA